MDPVSYNAKKLFLPVNICIILFKHQHTEQVLATAIGPSTCQQPVYSCQKNKNEKNHFYIQNFEPFDQILAIFMPRVEAP